MSEFLNTLKNSLLISIFILFASLLCFAQNKFDLEAKMETSVKSIYGGEKFTITVKAINHSSQTATDTYFNLNLNDNSLLVISSAIPSQGRVEFYNEKEQVICRFGDIKGGETATAKIELQIAEFGDVSQIDKELYAKLSTLSESARIAMSNVQIRLGKDDQSKEIYIRGSVGEAEAEESQENNTFRLYLKAFPSKNIPPRVEVVSPQNAAVIVKAANKPLEVPISVKAYDPDGKIVKVYLSKQNIPVVINGKEYKYVIEGKEYSQEEIDKNPKYFWSYFNTELKPIGNDVYTLASKDFIYGDNRLLIVAVDDGGRATSNFVDIKVIKS